MKSVIKRISIIPAGLLLCMGTVSALAEEEGIEEVIVTGSYIKRDNFDSASPMQIIDQVELSAEATPSLGEIMANQTFNFGSDIFANGYARRYQEGNVTSANLRGLGATLTLIDGKRTSNSNLNNMLPQIAIARVDILKDGASALYGSDAVAGVVNIIPRKNFTGMEVSLFHNQDSKADHDENVFDFIMGTDTDNGHITFAAEWRQRDELTQKERPEYRFPRAFARSEVGNPGSYLVPGRDATGALTGSSSQLADPGCGLVDGPGGTNEAATRNNISGQVKYNGQICYFYFGEFFNYVNANKQISTWFNYQYEFTDNLDMEIDFMFSKQSTKGRSSPSNPGGRTDLLPPIPGEHPGNPWRAMADRGSGLEPIFALDMDGDGVADRDADGVVLLPADPYDSDQGIAFNEDVVVSALRLFGKLGNLPTNGRRSDGANTAEHTFERWTYRLFTTLNYEIPNSTWNTSLTAIYQHVNTDDVAKNASISALLHGIDGELGVNRDEYFNPFSTQAFTCVDRVCTDTGAQAPNSDDVINSIDIMDNFLWFTDYYIFDLVASGSLFDLPAGTVQGAFGAQYRDFTQEIDDYTAANACDRWINGCGFDYVADRTVKAVFFEFAVPLLSGGMGGEMELQLAGRYSDYGSGVGDSFDPKVAVRWQPVEMLSIRASYSTAFVAPSLTELFSPVISFLQTVDDPLSGDQGTFRTNTFNGNPNLKPEEADIFNVGFSLSLLEGDLTLGVDYAEFDFTDRIATTNAQNVIDDDFAAFTASGRDVTNAADVADWLACCASPDLLRGPSGTLAQIFTSYVNANTMNVKSYDFYANYLLATSNWGDYQFSLNATLMDEYKYDLGGPLKGDGVGKQNDTIGAVPPTPEWRVTGTLNWNYGNHHVLLRGRWTDEITINGLSTGLNGLAAAGSFGTLAFIQFCDLPSCYRNVIDSELLIDIAYSYQFHDLFGSDRTTRIEVGSRNVTDEMPDVQMTLGGMDTFISDPRGRMVYLRLNQDI